MFLVVLAHACTHVPIATVGGGATYAHVVCSEDMIVQGMFRQAAPLAASSWAGRTGLSEPMPMPGPDWVNYGSWTRRVKVDLGTLRNYGAGRRH